MLYPLLRILLEALVLKTHNLLQEEICLSVYSMASINFPTYHHQFVGKYLTCVEGVSETQRMELLQNYKMVEVSVCV